MLPPTVQTRSTWSALISYHPSGQRASAVAMTGQAVGSPVPGSAGHGRQLLSGTASGGGRSGGRGSPPALTINFRARGSAAEHHQQREGGQAGNTSQQFWSDDAGLVRTSAAAAAAVASSGGAAGVLISAAVSAPPQSSGISVSPAAQLHSPRSAPGGPSRRAITQPAGSQTSDGAPSPTPSAAAAGGMRRPDGAAQAGTPDAAAGPAHSQAPAARNSSNSMHPQFRSKAVCKLTCVACEATVCSRGMKAILLADTRVELYSTDTPPIGYARASAAACDVRANENLSKQKKKKKKKKSSKKCPKGGNVS
ncbi:MAG: hypothetical protein BJ554DRAFT_1727 [Olpidium bornovanus]|uniref:Uncharacterized protein n=1 Tax=Olpidium bornovanus TaxID=278681 RepID=A0A8H7ZS02_9FUNG|nr:MAG: hypothetical protein BJ554DRAFT_1727 [Olpidium bornovanus]